MTLGIRLTARQYVQYSIVQRHRVLSTSFQYSIMLSPRLTTGYSSLIWLESTLVPVNPTNTILRTISLQIKTAFDSQHVHSLYGHEANISIALDSVDSGSG
jgi:hypothetical protein